MTLRWAEDIHKYFGYWTEEREGGPDLDQPSNKKKLMDSPSDYEEMGMLHESREVQAVGNLSAGTKFV